jgi:hypothetical protein
MEHSAAVGHDLRGIGDGGTADTVGRLRSWRHEKRLSQFLQLASAATHRLSMSPDDFFALSKDIRYVATYSNGHLTTDARADLSNASASESDKYEELFVNPTLLKLTTQRGNLDCGGLDYVVIRYGNFFQLVIPVADGHVSICIEPHADLQKVIAAIQARLKESGAASQ